MLRVSDRSRFVSAHSGGVQHSPMNDAQLLRDVSAHASRQLGKRVTPWEHSRRSRSELVRVAWKGYHR